MPSISRVWIALLALSLPAVMEQGRAAERYVAVLSVDGLGANDLLSSDSCLARDSTIRALAKQGAHASGVTGILPTVTYPTHASIVTGSDPVTHGIIDNAAPGVFWLKNRSDIRVDTLWDAAKRAGKKVAIVTWPSTYGANADFLVPEDLAPRTVPTEDIRKGSTPGLFDSLAAAVGKPELLHFGHADSGEPLDRMTATFAAEIVRREKPHLLLAHFLDYDHRMHRGPGSPATCRALELIDGWIAHLVKAYEAAGIRDTTTFFIVSDHGFVKVENSLNVLALLRNADWAAISPDEGPEKVFDFRLAGGSVALYPLQPRPAEWIEKVRAHLRPRIEAAQGSRLRWITPEEARAFGGFPDAVVTLCARPGFSFRMLGVDAPELIVNPGNFVGAHGYCPDEPRMDALFIASGDGIRAAGDIGKLRMKDVGPTIASVLGVTLKDATGSDESRRFR